MKSNTTIIITIALIIAGFAYWYFFTGTGNEAPLSAVPMTTNQAQVQFEMLVGELQPVSFNTSIFTDARFNALVDIGTQITPEAIGRLDPLAPFSATNVIAPAPSPASTPPVVAPTETGTSTPPL